MRTILFICSGNYYRSRFAEAFFNHHAEGRGLPWRAISRGLATHLVRGLGDLSIHTRFALTARGIGLQHTAPAPRQLSLEDLQGAERSIALKETEHRPLMRDLFPDWEKKIEYWTVHDLDFATPEEALPAVEKRIFEMLDSMDQAGTNQEKTQQPP